MKAKGKKSTFSDKCILVTDKQNREYFTFVTMIIGQAIYLYNVMEDMILCIHTCIPVQYVYFVDYCYCNKLFPKCIIDEQVDLIYKPW